MLLEGLGFAVGSVAGGVLASVTRSYLSNLVVQALLYVVLFFVCLRVVSEQSSGPVKHRPSLRSHLEQGKQVVLSSRKFSLILVGVILVGFFLSTVETYWQPAFMKITKSDNIAWMLGLITFIGFFTVIFGSAFGQKLLDKFQTKWWGIYIAVRILFCVSIVALAVQGTAGGFVIGYVIVYMCLGINNVVESTLINKLTPANMRASMLSLSSLIAQIGMIAAAIFSSILVGIIGSSGIWIVSGSLLGVCTLIVAVAAKGSKGSRISQNGQLSGMTGLHDAAHKRERVAADELP